MNMNALESTKQEIDDKGIGLYEVNTNEIQAACTNYLNQKSIFYDKEKFSSQKEIRIALEHELSHCEWDVFYKESTSIMAVKKREYKANKATVLKLLPINVLLPLLKRETPIWEIAEELDLTEEFIKMSIKIYKQMGEL